MVPPAAAAGGNVIKLDINGTVVESKSGSNAAVAVPWPGAGLNRTTITVAPDTGAQTQQMQQPTTDVRRAAAANAERGGRTLDARTERGLVAVPNARRARRATSGRLDRRELHRRRD